MRQRRNNLGFTMAEMLITVGILVVLAGVAFVGVANYLRNMKFLELNSTAKEIFIAAQNHLSEASSQGYLGRSPGTAETAIDGVSDTGVYYYVIGSNHADVNSDTTVLNLMLPVASIDEQVRQNGCYIIRYHRDSGKVLDVFYSEPTGRYAHTLTNADYTKLMEKRNNESARKTYGDDKAVIGYYGGEEAANLTKGNDLNIPKLVVENEERLRVIVTDTNDLFINSNLKMRLAITGKTSGNSVVYDLAPTGGGGVVEYASGTYTLVLDDITTENKTFYKQFNETSGTTEKLIPGEDIIVTVRVENTAQLAKSQFLEETTNSLYGYDPEEDNVASEKALIKNFRHLENLYKEISHVGDEVNGKTVSYSKAEQRNDLSWKAFVDSDATKEDFIILGNEENNKNRYIPVSGLPSGFVYDGGNHGIVDLDVNYAGPAGVFGTLTDTTIQNLTVYNKTEDATPMIASTSGSAGGLVGEMSGGSVENCAAAVYVNAQGSAGGLVGSATGSASITNSYSGGHTYEGKYSTGTVQNASLVDKTFVNVVSASGDAGGLVGNMNGSVTNCYSTCSVSGSTSAGGLAGTVSGTVANCYALGLVMDVTGSSTTKGAFAGKVQSGATGSGCYYLGSLYSSGVKTAGVRSFATTAGKWSGSVTPRIRIGSVMPSTRSRTPSSGMATPNISTRPDRSR